MKTANSAAKMAALNHNAVKNVAVDSVFASAVSDLGKEKFDNKFSTTSRQFREFKVYLTSFTTRFGFAQAGLLR